MNLEKYSDVLITCPMPGQEGVMPERLGDFMQTELGQKVLGESIKNIGILVETGMGEEQALTIALGAAAVRDEEGNIKRSPEQATADKEESAQLAESKKK